MHNALSSKELKCELVDDVQSDSTLFKLHVTGPGFGSISPQVTSMDIMNNKKSVHA